jgi:Tfp pilus assembly protein PilN
MPDRYDPSVDGGMYVPKNGPGDWVRYSDYAEALATIARLERDKDHLLTKADGDYLRQRLGEMVELEAERDALLEAEQRYQLDLHTVKAERDELLEALRDLADKNNDFSEALVRARLAIAKATTGEQS